MPKFHNDEKLKQLLLDNNVPLSDAVKRGEFYRNYFNWDNILKEYNSGLSIKDLCTKYNLSYDTVRENLRRCGAEFRKFTFSGTSAYNIYDSLFFPHITPVGAYVLGWIYSDGCIPSTYQFIDITLSEKDKDHLKYLSGLFTDKLIKKTYYGYTQRVYGKDFIIKLSKTYNILPRKSHLNFEIPFELFSSECIPYLVLGIFEGDGSISGEHLGASMLLTKNTWDKLQWLLPLEDLVNYVDMNDYGLIQLYFNGKNLYSVFGYIYGNTPLINPLKRKYERFITQLKRSMNGVTSPYRNLAVNTWDSLNLQ